MYLLTHSQYVKDVHAFVGLALYYQKFVKGFATIAELLTRLTSEKVRFEWSPKAQATFEALKEALMETTSLAFAILNVPCILDTDASKVAVGPVLSQKIDGIERPIAFSWRVMSEIRRNIAPCDANFWHMSVQSLEHFRHYLLGTKVSLRTDHYSLKWIHTFKMPEGILAYWIETLVEFDLEIEHYPGLSHSNIDGMSRPFCKQCFGKELRAEWVNELERASELMVFDMSQLFPRYPTKKCKNFRRRTLT